MRHCLWLILALLVGCTSYRYDVVTPDGGEREVKADLDLVIHAPPAELRLRQVESRCVVVIENPQTEAITLNGAASAIVDPSGQSRSLPTQLIPPGAYIKLVLPPLDDRVPTGPRWNIGLGVGMRVDASSPRESQDLLADIDPQAPRKATYLLANTQSIEYWEWDGAGSVRLILAFEHGGQQTRHDFTIRREKK